MRLSSLVSNRASINIGSRQECVPHGRKPQRTWSTGSMMSVAVDFNGCRCPVRCPRSTLECTIKLILCPSLSTTSISEDQSLPTFVFLHSPFASRTPTRVYPTMARITLPVIAIAVAFSALPGALAGPACTNKQWNSVDECIQKCNNKWGWAGHIMGSDPWGVVVKPASGTDDPKKAVETACKAKFSGSHSTSAASTTKRYARLFPSAHWLISYQFNIHKRHSNYQCPIGTTD
jgi:hypothetical protein